VDEAVNESSYLEPVSLSMAAYHGAGYISIYKSASKNAGPFSARGFSIEAKRFRTTPEFFKSIEGISDSAIPVPSNQTSWPTAFSRVSVGRCLQQTFPFAG